MVLALSGCTALPKRPVTGRQFRFERAWARSTVTPEYSAYRIAHQMQPYLTGSLVLQGNAIDGLTAFDSVSGHVRWRRDIKGGVEGGVTVNGETLFTGGNDGTFYALDVKTGRTRWSIPLRSEGLGRPVVDSNLVFFGTGAGLAYAVRADTGEQKWLYTRSDTANLTVRGVAEPTISDQVVLFGFSDGSLVALNKQTGTVNWEKRLGTAVRFKDVDSRPVVRGDRVYVSSYDGLFYCLSLKDGAVIWSSEDGGFQTPEVHDDRVFVATSDSRVVALDAKIGTKLWDTRLGGKSTSTVGSSPVYYRGLVLVGEWQGRLKALDAKTGAVVADYSTGRGVVSPLKLDSDRQMAFVTGTNGDLFAFRLVWDTPSERWDWEK
jgi:outer membrane protein assembly factor BamB